MLVQPAALPVFKGVSALNTKTQTNPAALPEKQVPAWHYRLRYRRLEPAIWLAHLDMMRTFERSVRRAGWPIAWSQGYNPRPQLTFALPISVGLATEDDYFDAALTADWPPALLLEKLNPVLPLGFAVTAAGRIGEESSSLMSQVSAADYRLEHDQLADAWKLMSQLPSEQPWLVDKKSKGKIRTIDIRPLLLEVRLDNPAGLEIRVQAGSQANLRPDLFLQALCRYGQLPLQTAGDTRISRLKLWVITDKSKKLRSPFDQARDKVCL